MPFDEKPKFRDYLRYAILILAVVYIMGISSIARYEHRLVLNLFQDQDGLEFFSAMMVMAVVYTVIELVRWIYGQLRKRIR